MKTITVEMWELEKDIAKAKEEVEKTGKEYQASVDKLNLYETKLKSICTHPRQIMKDSYSSGGYDYQSESRSWMECVFCGSKVGDTKIKYGGFA